MKRYIRTKDGKIIDLQAVNHSIRHSKVRKINNGDIEIVKQTDTIEELIEVGDLIIYKEDYVKPRAYIIYNEASLYVYAKLRIETIFELYTKQGNDYILVARKENGEWRVI